jgi:glycosyltransferase involved in cell wall biosynthesis
MSLRILWISDAPWAVSGYSQITRQQAPAIAALGHDVALLATFGLHGAIQEWRGLRVYPGGADSFANDVIGHAARDWQADVVITLKDSFVFKPEAMQGLRWLGMVPCDHEPLAPVVAQVCHAMYRPIAYAPNGFRELRKAGFDPLFAPHSFDPNIMHPVDRTEARKMFGFHDDIFVIGTVAVNRGGLPSRKAWPQNLEAFALFAKDKPNARYFIHTDIAADGFEGGINLAALCGQLGIMDKVMFCDQVQYRRATFGDDYLRMFYGAIDVLNAVSLGEGFGIPALEAQAVGTPVIVSDFAAHRDLCFSGWKVREDEGIRFYDGQASWIFIPQPSAIADAMQFAFELLSRNDHREAYRSSAISGAAPYALPRVIEEHWRPLLEEVERDIRGEVSRGVLRIVRPEEVGLV